ncbi:FxsA family protein, partial [Salmonella enterica subsp. enterica serovar Kentucky]|nr:FxsA family protein [Salmonella enterica subsp. enterica serovar Kentucky]
LLPGFFTDFLGLLLLLPPVQKHLTLKLLPHLRFSRMPGGGFSGIGIPVAKKCKALARDSLSLLAYVK